MKASASLLTSCGGVHIPPLSERVNLRQAFRRQEHLFPFWRLRKLLRKCHDATRGFAAELAMYDLTASAYDSEMQVEVPLRLRPTRLWHAATLLESQMDGTPGPLLTNGLANIFPLGGFSLWLYWYEVATPKGPLGRWWGAEIEPYGSVFWFRGSRLFLNSSGLR